MKSFYNKTAGTIGDALIIDSIDVVGSPTLTPGSVAQVCSIRAPEAYDSHLVFHGESVQQGGESDIKWRVLIDGNPVPDFSGPSQNGFFGSWANPWNAQTELNIYPISISPGQTAVLEATHTNATGGGVSWLVAGRMILMQTRRK